MVIWWWVMLRKQNSIISKYFQVHESKYSKFESIDYLLNEEFFDKDKLEKAWDDMINYALDWYVKWLNDPYTVYLKKEENNELSNELKDKTWFAWIWAVIEKQSDSIIISEIIKNSPAAKAWLLPLDEIYMVDDQNVTDLAVTEVVWLIRGEKWTEVNLFIKRLWKDWSEDMKFWIPIIRDDVKVPSVNSELFNEKWKNILYLEVSIISSRTTSLLLSEIRETLENIDKIDWLILDLRWNSWWYLEEAIKLLWHFFPEGTVLAQSRYRAYDDINHISQWRWELWNYPIVILVDQLTASAWEIIAVAFQENWFPVVWMQTFGKWSIQTVQDFIDWSSLKYTVWKWYSWKGNTIDTVWITPDIEIPWDYESYKSNWKDNQLEAAKTELLKLIN